MPTPLPSSQRRKTRSHSMSDDVYAAFRRVARARGLSASRALEEAIERYASTPDLELGEHAVIADPRGGYLIVRRVATLDQAQEHTR